MSGVTRLCVSPARPSACQSHSPSGPGLFPAPSPVSNHPSTWGTHTFWEVPGEISVLSGKTAPTPLPDTLRPDSLVKMTLGGMTLTLLHTSAPSSGPPDLTTHFFSEFDATKDGPFGSRDFHHLRPCFQRACPCSHVRYKPKAGAQGKTPSAPQARPLMPSFSLAG